MSHKTGTRRRGWKERALSLILAAALTVGLAPALTAPASAHWADGYLDQLVDWGVMRADQTANPDAPLTRAEFMAIINRAYGYTETGPIPFTDVNTTDWFYDDVSIAYTAGYMAGTSDVTASPNDTLTREQAVVILGRNMMLKETTGESLAFADSRDVSDWARGTIKTAVDNYIVSGYTDNTFHPQDPISKGQMAVLISQCVGNPIQSSGVHELGGVFGNVTITTPDVTLRNTTISGDLYVSGGVGLGGIKLENVNVLGRIIVSGTGESEAGAASVVMRNVTAQDMLVDNMRNKTVTIRADGITDIAKTTVRTNAYIEDNNTDANGLSVIELDGDPGSRLTLAGRVKEVVNKTPNSLIQVAKGTVAKLTVDEAAVNSAVQLDRNTEVKEMNLDVATNVTGDGDIGQLNVNAPGSVVSMLPEKIYIRPGLTANIAGVIMDHQAAEEGSLDPRLLSGYPAAKDITPTGLRADFAGNKKGVIYWAVSNITDGSIGEDDLISPPSYGSKAIRNGTVAAPAGGSEISSQITGLTVGGAYYLSALLVDDQGNRSPVKVVSFSTPDNTVPAFGQGYPYMSFIGKANEYETLVTAQVAVMATKTCKMYYAVLPAGTAAPTTDELRSAAVPANLGYGVMDLEKNEVWDGDRAVIVSRRLEEQKNYVLYLWLTDGVNNSAVTSLAFTTPDVTPPQFVVNPYVNGDAQLNAVPMAATINENGTIFWVAVESGTLYPKHNPQNDRENDPANDNKTALLTSSFAKLQVANGMNCASSGRVNATGNTLTPISITGLEAEKSYDVYFLARDTAGNDGLSVYKLPGSIRTLDTGSPTVRQFFTKFDTDSALDPWRDTDIVLEFSENVSLSSGPAGGRDLLTLYQDTQNGTASEKEAALRLFVAALRSCIDFKESKFGIPQSAVRGNPNVEEDDWVIDFELAQAANVNGKLQITFSYERGAHRLASGGIYNFAISNLEDMSGHKMEPEGDTVDFRNDTANGHRLPQFTVGFDRVNLTSVLPLTDEQQPKGIASANYPGGDGGYRADFKFRMYRDSADAVSDDVSYDLLIWNDYEEGLTYDLYYRAVTKDGRVLTVERDEETGEFLYGMPNMASKVHNVDESGWVLLGSSGDHYPNPTLLGKSLHKEFNQCGEQSFPRLNTLLAKTRDTQETVYYDFVISVRSMNSLTNPMAWSGPVTFYVDIATGVSSTLYGLSASQPYLSENSWNTFITEGLNSSRGGESIGLPNDPAGSSYPERNRLKMFWKYEDSVQPTFNDGYPRFVNIQEESATINLNLRRNGIVYYVIGYADVNGSEPANTEEWQPSPRPLTMGGTVVRPENVPLSGDDRDLVPELSYPLPRNIRTPSTLQGGMIVTSGSQDCGANQTVPVNLSDLDPNRTYYAYFVIRGSGAEPSAVEMYKFKTSPVSRPVITITPNQDTNPGRAAMSPDIDATLTYKVYLKSEIEKVDMLRDDYLLSRVLDPSLSLPPYYQNFTVYRALRTPYQYSEAVSEGAWGYFPTDSNGNPGGRDIKRYSVFDVYASDTAKGQLRTWLELNVGSSGLINSGEPDMADPGRTVNVRGGGTEYSASVLQRDTIYYVLAMACRNPLDETVSDGSVGLYYSFAGQEIPLTDSDPPNLDSATGQFNLTSSNTIKDGYITLSFDKTLYYYDSAGILKEITSADLRDVFKPSTGIDFDNPNTMITNDRKDNRSTVTLYLEPGATNVTMTVPRRALKNSGEVGADAELGMSYFWPNAAGDNVIIVTWTDYTKGENDRNRVKTWTIRGNKEQPVDTKGPKVTRASAVFKNNPGTDTVSDGGYIELTFDKKIYYEDAGNRTPVQNANDFFKAASAGSSSQAAWGRGVTVVDQSNTTCVVTIDLSTARIDPVTGLTLEIETGQLKNISGFGMESDLKISIVKVSGSTGGGGSSSGLTSTQYEVTVENGSFTYTETIAATT